MFHAINPVRNSDTRGFGGNGVGPGELRFSLHPGVPSNAVAVAMNVAAVPAGTPGFVTVWPTGPRPDTSVVNFEASGAHNGAMIVGVSNGGFQVYTSAQAHLICDITGYWTA